MSRFQAEIHGAEHAENYRIFYRNEQGKYLSPLHDIPLYANKDDRLYNMVVEIPRWTCAKMEIATNEPLNPIRQDQKNGKLRFVSNCFPHHGYMWNYGALPQTWENPNVTDPNTGAKGDDDPIDVIEVGSRIARRGEIIQIKIIGILGMIDDGESDWKLISIDIRDKLAPQINDIKDLEKVKPGYLCATLEWLRGYKIPAGGQPNEFAFNGDAMDKDFAFRIIEETHEEWKQLMEGKIDRGKINLTCTLTNAGGVKLGQDEAVSILGDLGPVEEPLPVPNEASEWHFVGSAYDKGSRTCAVI